MKTNPTFFTVSTLMVSAALLLQTSDLLALNAGQEMGASVQRLANLLHGNVMHAIMVVGMATSAAMSFFKSSFVPGMVGIGTGVLYGFSHTWVDTAFAICV